MGLSALDSRALADIEHRLCTGDPPLARLFDEFAEVSRGAAMPARGWRRCRPARGWQLAALLLALIVVTGVITAIFSGMAHATCLVTPEAGHAPASVKSARASDARCRPQQRLPQDAKLR